MLAAGTCICASQGYFKRCQNMYILTDFFIIFSLFDNLNKLDCLFLFEKVFCKSYLKQTNCHQCLFAISLPSLLEERCDPSRRQTQSTSPKRTVCNWPNS